jgi:hypothetical protein
MVSFKVKPHRARLNKNSNKLKPIEDDKSFDLLKILGFIVTLLGILSWIAGAAFQAGYWGVPGLETGLTAKSIQQTALSGFIDAFHVWIKAVIVMGLIALVLAPMGISRKKTSNSDERPKRENAIKRWLRVNFTYDKSTGYVSVGIFSFAYVLGFFVVMPMAFWALTAYFEGKIQFEKQICRLRSGETALTKITTDDGKKLSGYVIDRTENEALLLDSDFLHFLKMQDRPPRLQYSFNLPAVNCPVKR